MEVFLSFVKWLSALKYLDDIVVFSKKADNHIAPLQQVMTLPRDAGVTLVLKNCLFAGAKINYLDDVIRLVGSELSETIAAALHELKNPTTPTELRSF